MKNKFAIIADLHIGRNVYGQFDPKTGIHTHSKVILGAIEKLALDLKQSQVEDLFIAGDIFHRRNPSMTDWEVFNQVIDLLLKDVQRIYIAPGNHDDSALFTTSLTPFQKLVEREDRVKLVSTYEYFQSDTHDIEVALFSTFSKRWSHQGFSEFLESEKFSKKSSCRYRICICHEMIDGATFNGSVFESKLKVSQLQKYFAFTFAGHVHQFQEVSKNVFYCGPLTHLDFGDRDSHIGYILVGLDHDNQLGFYPKKIESRKYLQVEGSVEEIRNQIFSYDSNDVVKFKIRDTYENISKLSEELKNLKCYTIIETYPTVKKEVKKTAIQTDMDPKLQFQEYLKGSSETDQETLDLGLSILEEVR